MTLLTITGLPCAVETLLMLALAGVLCIGLISDAFKKRG